MISTFSFVLQKHNSVCYQGISSPGVGSDYTLARTVCFFLHMILNVCYILVLCKAFELCFLVFDVCRILHGNKLIGSIPKELGMLKSLKVLDLGVNQLTGPIPPEIASINGVTRM